MEPSIDQVGLLSGGRSSPIVDALLDDTAPSSSMRDTEEFDFSSGDSGYRNVESFSGPASEEHVNQVPYISEVRRRLPVSKPVSVNKEEGQPEQLLRQISVRMEHAATTTFILTGLTFKLLRYLGIGYKWITKFAWLMMYAALLLPGFLQAVWYYFLSGRVLRSIVYGDQPRNTLDLYMPCKGATKQRPVVIFITGGAWVIGYKAWGTLLGWALADREILVASIDYRNFPQGSVSDMIGDVTTGIGWVFKHIAHYGGDPQKVFLVSQSAGAHLSCMAILQAAMLQANGGGPSLPWQSSDLKAFIGISGGYDLACLVDHFHNRGLYRSIFLSIMEGISSLPRFSPTVVVRSPDFEGAASLLPPITLFHGTADISIPCEASRDFASALNEAGASVKLRLLHQKTHTDLVIQDLMRGGKDELLDEIIEVVRGDDEEKVADLAAQPRRRMLPEFLLQAARIVSPF